MVESERYRENDLPLYPFFVLQLYIYGIRKFGILVLEANSLSKRGPALSKFYASVSPRKLQKATLFTKLNMSSFRTNGAKIIPY